MITVEVKEDEIQIIGHANYAEIGKDIVCSAVSTLYQNLIISLTELTNDKITYKIKAGDSSLSHKELSSNGRLLKNSFILGVQDIVETYPNHVSLEIKERL